MIEKFLMVVSQVLILFILIGVGFFCGKVKFLNENATKKLTDIVLYIVTPCVMIQAFQREFEVKMLVNLCITALCATAIMVGSIFISNLVFREKDISRKKVLRFATVFSNCGFMSLPLEKAILGQDGLFYGSVFVAIFNVLVWTYGLVSMSGDKKDLSIKKLVTNPGILGVVVGVVLFVCSITLPEVIETPVEYLAALNTPVPMIIIGFYLSQSKLKKIFCDKWAYVSMALRLVVLPLGAVFVMYLCGVRSDILIACAIAASAPVAATTTMFATKFNRNVELSVGLVSATTLLSIVTMPLIISIATLLS